MLMPVFERFEQIGSSPEYSGSYKSSMSDDIDFYKNNF
jgi:hypothetical protein